MYSKQYKIGRKLRIIGVQNKLPLVTAPLKRGGVQLFDVISIATAFMPLDRLMSGVGFSPNLLSFG
jgi:hypothetical protein